MTYRARGQVLAFMAIVLPIVLMPVAAYAVDAATVSTAASGLHEITAQAAEEAAQQLSVAGFRAGAGLVIDAAVAESAARNVVAEEPGATVRSVVVVGTVVTVETTEVVSLPLNFLGAPAVKLEARASAWLAAGYDKPNSRLPLPTRSF